MKYTQETKDAIVKLSNQGWSSREIAGYLNISKSGVNGYLQGLSEGFIQAVFPDVKIGPKEVTKPKILVFDIETACTVAGVFGRFKQNIGQANVIQEGGWLLTVAYKWLGEHETHVLAFENEILAASDLSLCEELHKLYAQADAVIAHNAPFDHKMLQTRCLINGLAPLPTVKVIDTLQMARKNFRFNSNRLDSLGELLGLGGKEKHEGMKMWLDVQQGDLDALDRMKSYNARDVDLLEEVYYKLRSLGHQATLFNAGLYFDDGKHHCNVCGSDHVAKTGNPVYTALSEFEEYECLDCGAKMRGRDAKNTKAQRSKLLTSIVN